MKKQIAVLFGGCSPEHEISLQSAAAVLGAMDRTRYDVLPVGITKEGDWFLYRGAVSRIADGSWRMDAPALVPAAVSPGRTEPGLLALRGQGWERIPVDAVFPVMHGRNGEDGTVQGLFELAGVRVVGCGTLASALCMDKQRAHALAAAAGVAVPRAAVLGRQDLGAAAQLTAPLAYPLFIKPLRAGSSFGITRIQSPDELEPALARAFAYDDMAVAEQAVEGFEVGCAVIGGSTLRTGRVDEIELSGGFFDFDEKYSLRTARIHVPARITPELEQRVTQTAKTVYRALGCSGFARVDLFLTPEGGIVFNEVNTIPGFTEHSRFPGMFRAAGMSFAEVVAAIVDAAVGA